MAKLYIAGINISQLRKICRYIFGSYFSDARINEEKGIFEVQMYKEINGEPLDIESVKDFMDFWGESNFKFYYADEIKK